MSVVKSEGASTSGVGPARGLTVRYSISPRSETEHSLSADGAESFVTSTPIKGGKENVVRSDSDEHWSPTILLSKRRRHLKETNEVL